MPRINLPGDKSATIVAQAEISERSARAIELAYLSAIQTSAKLSRMGKEFDAEISADDPDIEQKLEDLYDGVPLDDINKVRVYEAVFIVNMVKSWDVLEDPPTPENVLDIPRSVFTVLAAACSEEFNRKTDFTQDGKDDPLADGGN